MTWIIISIILFLFLVLLEIGVQMFINYGRQKPKSYLIIKIADYKARKAEKVKNNEIPM